MLELLIATSTNLFADSLGSEASLQSKSLEQTRKVPKIFKEIEQQMALFKLPKELPRKLSR
jgi:hypothetical protein